MRRAWMMIAITVSVGCVPGAGSPDDTIVRHWVNERIESIAHVAFELTEPATAFLAFSFEDGDSRRTPPRELGAGVHEEVLLGVPFGSTITYELVVERDGDTWRSDSREVTNASASDRLPPATLSVAEPPQHDADSRYVYTSVTSDSTSWALIYDRQGRVVWGLQMPRGEVSLHPRVALGGTSLWVDHNAYWGGRFATTGSTLERISIDGVTLQTEEVPGFHHPFVDLPDGRIAYGQAGRGRQRDERIAVLSPGGTPTMLWSCHDTLGDDPPVECGSNTISYHEPTDSLLFSLYSHDTVFEVDATSGATRRWFGEAEGAYAFDPPESAFRWQHGGHITAQGTLLTSAHTIAGDEIVVREYAIDEAAEALREVASFGVGGGVFAEFMGEAHRLGNGNLLHNTGSLARLREVTPGGDVVWDLTWGTDQELGRSTFVGDLYDLR